VPSGEYRITAEAGLSGALHGIGGADVLERFACAPGPAGWRYAATRYEAEVGAGAEVGKVDVTVDARWRHGRVELRTGAWLLRGGVAGRDVLWVRAGTDGQAAAEQSTPAAGFWAASPAFLVTTARMLALSPGEVSTVALLGVTGDALAARTVRQRWTLLDVTDHPTDTRALPVERYEVADLDTGLVAEAHVAGDVVLSAPGVELLMLDGPPTLDPR
jgi:hypothetical protein